MQVIEQTITSVEAAQWCGKLHKNLLSDIKGYEKELGELKIQPTDFFKKSTYKTKQNKELPCFLVTKKGCEFIAHKMTGIKGTEFTARYINRFHEMEEQLQKENHMDWFVNDIRVFQHKEFGMLRTLKLDGQDYFIGQDATRSLGYVNNNDTLKKRVSNSEKCYVAICDGTRSRKMVAITKKGLDELINTGKLPLASKYNEWIQKQVMPALTKKDEMVPVSVKMEQLKEELPAPKNKPLVRTVVNIPENPEAQKAILEIKKALGAVDVMLDESNRYLSEDSFKRYRYDMADAFAALMTRITCYLDIKPRTIEKQY